jgi:hypothetical protein
LKGRLAKGLPTRPEDETVIEEPRFDGTFKMDFDEPDELENPNDGC